MPRSSKIFARAKRKGVPRCTWKEINIDLSFGPGFALIAMETLGYLGKDLHGATAVVQGFGKVGQVVASELATCDCKIIAVGDTSGGNYASTGLDVDRLLEHKGEPAWDALEARRK